MFKSGNLKTMMFGTFIKHSGDVVDMLEKFCKGDKSVLHQDIKYVEPNIINIQTIFYRFTFDSIGEIAFGTNIGSLHKPTPASISFDASIQQTNKRFTTNAFWKVIYY